MPMGGIPGAVGGGGTIGVSNVEMSHGFGFGGNPGAPALPTAAMGGFSPSIGLLQSVDMKSLDNYMEQQVAAMTTAGMPSTTAVAAQFANVQSQAATGAQQPSGGQTKSWIYRGFGYFINGVDEDGLGCHVCEGSLKC